MPRSDWTKGLLLSRRQALGGIAALAAPAVIGSQARAQSSRVVVATWGGDYARLLNQNVEVPFLQKDGITVIQDVADEAPRVAKVEAQRRLPRGNVDVVSVTAVSAYQLAQLGMLETLDATKVPNLAHALPSLCTTSFAPHIYSPQQIIYCPARVPNPPITFAELIDPKYAGKVGFPDVTFIYAMMAASLYASGTTSDMEKAKALMVKLNANGLRLYPTTDAAGPPYQSGELNVGLMWMARVVMWQNAGIPVQGLFPKEGAVLYISGMVVPKNAPNKEAAYKYINAMLEPGAQRGFAQTMGYLPTIDNAALTGKIAQQLALPNPLPKLVPPDVAFVAKQQPAVADWWRKTMDRT